MTSNGVKPLRVAYVTMLFPAASETFACLDVRELVRKGLTVEVHSLRPGNRDVDPLANERGVARVRRTYNGAGATLRGLGLMLVSARLSISYLASVVRLTTHRPGQLVKSLVLLPRVFDIFDRLRRDPPDVVHIYWGHYPALVGGLVQRLLPGTVVSMSLGAYDLKFDFPPTAPVAQQATFVRTHGHANVRALVDHVGVSEERVAVVYNGIDIALAPTLVAGAKRIPGRIVTAGRLVWGKAVDDVLRAFSRVRRERPEATLEVFGDGPERGRLLQLTKSLGLSDAVLFRGHQSQRELFTALAQAEIFLFMSKSERLPNVIKEAMACGAVCVSAETIGLGELIASPDHGVIVPQGAVDDAAEAVLSLLRRPGLMARLRENARRHIVDNFDVRRTTDAYLHRWSAAVDSHRTLERASSRAVGEDRSQEVAADGTQ